MYGFHEHQSGEGNDALELLVLLGLVVDVVGRCIRLQHQQKHMLSPLNDPLDVCIWTQQCCQEACLCLPEPTSGSSKKPMGSDEDLPSPSSSSSSAAAGSVQGVHNPMATRACHTQHTRVQQARLAVLWRVPELAEAGMGATSSSKNPAGKLDGGACMGATPSPSALDRAASWPGRSAAIAPHRRRLLLLVVVVLVTAIVSEQARHGWCGGRGLGWWRSPATHTHIHTHDQPSASSGLVGDVGAMTTRRYGHGSVPPVSSPGESRMGKQGFG